MAETETATEAETINMGPGENLPAWIESRIDAKFAEHEKRMEAMFWRVLDQAGAMISKTDERGDTEQENAAEGASFSGGVGE